MKTLRKILYSFHFDADVMRVQQIRNIGVIEENRPVTPNKWEEVKSGGRIAIQNWIDKNIARAECVVVLVGENTHQSYWVGYEIKKAWNDSKGLVGIYIHNLKDPTHGASNKGLNPFMQIGLKNGKKLSEYVSVYNPDTDAYNYIAKYLDQIVEKGIQSGRK
ncbi:MAG: TIR domain-containing protein [Candidatus Taylorbacteria bacterium]|nr:TIR domain-containing protein [Candidatus Taylorbacteria bacterium]